MSFNQVVSLEHAAILHGSKVVLQEVNLHIDKADFAYVVGSTGSGKTSLMKTLYADLKLKAGSGQVAGFDLSTLKKQQVPDLRRKLGIIFQDFQLFPDRNVAENLLFVLQATGWSDRAKIKNRIAEVLMQVGLANAEGRLPHQLSGGEQQRVVIARALLNEPAILIADEPTGNLDPDTSRGILSIFKEINRSGTAIFMATHNYFLLREFPAKVYLCANKTLRLLSPEEVAKL